MLGGVVIKLLILNVTTDKVTIKQDAVLNKGEYHATKCRFTFTKEYDGLVKNAIFFVDDKKYVMNIIDDVCDIPDKVFEHKGNIGIGAFAYTIDESGNSILRYSPEPISKSVLDGSYVTDYDNYKPITPSEFEQYQQALNDGLNKVSEQLIIMDQVSQDTKEKGDNAKTQGDYAKEQGDYAKSKGYYAEKQGNYAKEQGDYAKEKSNEVINANSLAISLINEFESNVNECTSNFNANADQKTNDYNENAETSIENFNTNAATKITDFNNNSKAKTSEFNTNYDTKLKSFDDNADSSTTDFNDNVKLKIDELDTYTTGKITEFNANSKAKLDAFNTNATAKTNDYNENAETSIENFNTNAATKITDFNNNSKAKTDEFNTNYDTKLKSFDDNADTKITNFNDNAKSETDEFVSNANTKKAEFNANAEQKTNEFNENVDELQQEIEYLRENQIKGSATGSYIHVKDSSLSKLKKLNVDGVGEQETTEGKQLFDFRDVSSKSDTITNDDEGWVTFVGNNVNGSSSLWGNFWTNNLQLKENTKYSIITEVKNVSGNGYIAPHSFFGNNGQFLREDPTSSTDERFQFSNLSAGQVIIQRATTRDNFSDITRGLRTYCLAMAGQSGSITFRLSVLEDTAITPENFVYEEYTGGQPSPSPSYPKPVPAIEGSLNVTICNKNLIKLKNGTYSNNGITAVVNNGTIKLNGTSTAISFINIPIFDLLLNGEFTWQNFNSVIGDNATECRLQSKNGDYKNLALNIENNKITRTYNDTYSTFLIKMSSGITCNNSSIIPMVEEGSTATPYDQHLESQITANLPEGEFAGKINDTDKDTFKVKYNQEDGKYHLILNKKIGRVVLNGSETFQVSNTIDNDKKRIWCSKIKDLIKKPTGNDIVGKILCSHYVPKTANRTYLLEQGISVDIEGYIFIYDNSNNTTDLTAFKNWLSTHNITIYYALATPYEVDLGVIDMPLSYCTITNVFTDSKLNPNIEIEYYKDLETVVTDLKKYIEELHNKQDEQIQGINTLLSTTRTSAILLDNYQNDLESEV